MSQWFVTFIVVLVAICVHFMSKWYLESKEHFPLVVLVLSSRYNFVERNSIRDSWMRTVGRKQAKVLFVVGDTDCSIPSSRRLSPFSCEKAKRCRSVVAPIRTHSVAKSSMKCTRVSRGFSFSVNSLEHDYF